MTVILNCLHLMEHKGLRQSDLLPVFGSRSVAADVLNGRREISKAHARKLADFFHQPQERAFDSAGLVLFEIHFADQRLQIGERHVGRLAGRSFGRWRRCCHAFQGLAKV